MMVSMFKKLTLSTEKGMKRVFFFFLLMVPFFSFSQEVRATIGKIPDHYKEKLEIGLRHALINTEMGSVLHGNKPICSEGIRVKNSLISLYTRNDKDSLYLKSLCEILQSLKVGYKGNFLIKISEREDFGFHEFLFINKSAFLRTVNENITLFQYILGPDVTAIKLLNKLLDPKESTHSILKDNCVLIGIVLGFGPQNSLVGSREELLSSNLFYERLEPLLREKNKRSMLQNQKSLPSFGYSSLQEEYTNLKKNFFLSTEFKEKGFPSIPTFGCQDSAESCAILKDFVQARENTRKLLDSSHFLKDFMQKSEIEIPSFDHLKKVTNNSLDENTIAKIIACLYEKFCLVNPSFHDKIWQEAFMEGLEAKSPSLPLKEYYKLLLETEEAKKAYLNNVNLDQVNAFFQEFQKRSDLVCVIPGKIYYKVLEEGQGSTSLIPQMRISLSYSLEDIPNEKTLFGCYDKVPLENLVSGVSLGLLGMKIGERREIWVHPEYAYGSTYDLDRYKPNVGLHTKIELLQAEYCSDLKNDISSNTLVCKKINHPENELRNRYEELKKKAGFFYGKAVGSLLQYGIDLKVVSKILKEKKKPQKLSLEEENMISSFYLSLYEKQKVEDNLQAQKQILLVPSSAKCIQKSKLYVECLKKGEGPVIKKDQIIEIRCCLKNHRGMILHQFLSTVDLKNSIKAFQLALPSQKVGSKVRLYIHPDFGFKECSKPYGDVFLIGEVEIISTKIVKTR